jgi:hypothetical protein
MPDLNLDITTYSSELAAVTIVMIPARSRVKTLRSCILKLGIYSSGKRRNENVEYGCLIETQRRHTPFYNSFFNCPWDCSKWLKF